MSSELFEESKLKPLTLYGILVAVLAVLKFASAFVLVPEPLAIPLSLVFTFVFVGLPITALISGSRHQWKTVPALLLVLVGATLHVAMFLTMRFQDFSGVPLVLLRTLMETAAMVWTLGLGAVVSILIREKNLLPPVVSFLAGFDMFIIFNPDAPQAKIVANNPEVVRNMGMTVPQVRPDTEESRKEGVAIRDLGYVGPADLFVTAALFAVLFRHRMRFRESAVALVPVLGGYMILALLPFFPGLPALVPIGATVLIVNRREFKMTKDEKMATWVVTFLAVGLAGFGVYKAITYTPPAEPTETLPLPGDPAPLELGG